MDSKWTKYLALPAEITPFEQQFLARLNKIALVFFFLHVPVLMVVAWAADTGPLFALIASLIVITGPALAFRTIQNPRWLSVVHGVTAMLMGGLLVHFGQGPVQIEMHFYFFALLAMLCIFANPMVNVAAACTVALHHLLVWWLLPGSVFNYDAQWWVVLVHSAFVILETVAACYISRQFFDNVIGLEKIVAARTATVHENQRDMQLILNNVEQGLITIDVDGHMSSETSLAVREWFGVPLAGENFATWIGRRDDNFGDWLDFALESFREDVLPKEVSLGQFPARLKDGAKTYSVHYQLIGQAEVTSLAGSAAAKRSPEKILVIITDITEILIKDAAGRHQSELLQLFQHMNRDRAGFLEFLAEADEIVRSLDGGQYEDLDHQKRLIHTLKGNTGIFGMRRVSEVCHEIENEVANEPFAALTMGVLDQAWSEIRPDIQKLIGDAPNSGIEIDEADYELILKTVREGGNVSTVSRMIESWRFEPATKRLARIRQQLISIAERSGKGSITVIVESNHLRFNSEHFAPFWLAFIHVIRNAVDHGIEDREERRKHGKLSRPTIKVTTAIENDRFVVAIEDDGPGIDWERLRNKASKFGVPASELEESTRLLSWSGLSSRDTSTELSGRGMGMGAMAEVCEALGGTMEVESRLGVGTRIRFSFAKGEVVHEGNGQASQCALDPVAA